MKWVALIILLSLVSSCKNESFDVTFSDAANCANHKLNYPNAVNGTYQLNLDEDDSTPLQSAYCDFDNGGWARIFNHETTVGDLEELGDTTPISATFYSDPTKGIGWGTQVNTGGSNPIPTQMSCFVLDKIKNISQIKITLTWDGINSAYGYLFIGNKIDVTRYTNWSTFYAIMEEEGFATALNAWGAGRNHGIQHYSAPTADVILGDWVGAVGRSVTAEGTYLSNGTLEICMGSESAGAYDRRFITEMSFK